MARHTWRWTRRDSASSTTWALRCACGIYLRQRLSPPQAQLPPPNRNAFIIFRDSHAAAGHIALPDVPAAELVEDHREATHE